MSIILKLSAALPLSSIQLIWPYITPPFPPSVLDAVNLEENSLNLTHFPVSSSCPLCFVWIYISWRGGGRTRWWESKVSRERPSWASLSSLSFSTAWGFIIFYLCFSLFLSLYLSRWNLSFITFDAFANSFLHLQERPSSAGQTENNPNRWERIFICASRWLDLFWC